VNKIAIGIVSFALVLGLGVAASSAQVTQTAVAIESKSLPADAFREKINAAVYDLTVTDVPAIITAVNAKAEATGAAIVANTLSVTSPAPVTLSTTQLTFTAVGIAAGTNEAAIGIKVRLNGTNYILNLFPN